MKLTAKHLKYNPEMDEWEPKSNGLYKVRSLDESNSGKKYIHVWGWKSKTELNEDWQLMVDGKPVIWE